MMFGLGRVRSAARRVVNRLRGGVVILLYHRVIDLASDPQWLAVRPELFDQQMEMVRRNYHVLSLRGLVETLDSSTLPRRAVVITFDDGYADLFEHARPILQRRDVPATFFVTTGMIGRPDEFYWDQLERFLLVEGRGEGELCAGGLRFNLPRMAEQPSAGAVVPGEVPSRWTVLAPAAPSPRHAAYKALCDRARPMDYGRRAALLEEVRAWAGGSSGPRATHRVMSESELAALGRCDHIEIGAHTVTHPRLSSLPVDAQHAEIAGSRRRLEQILGRPVRSFSYPFGSADDYTPQTIECVRSEGFTCACANFGGVVRRGDDRLQLHRVLVRDWNAEELDRRIRGWFNE